MAPADIGGLVSNAIEGGERYGRHAEAKLIAELISAPTVCYFADERR
jgi:hypothetical protein